MLPILVKTVLIGKAKNGPGVEVRIVNHIPTAFTDDREWKGLAAVDVNNIKNKFCALHESVVPSAENDMVFKVARYSGYDGGIWTWIGWYRYARFIGTARQGTYIGCGILALDRNINVASASSYISDLIRNMDALVTKDGLVSVSVFDIDENQLELKPSSILTVAQDPSRRGLQPNKTDARLFIDLSGFSEKLDFDSKLTSCLQRAQDDVGFVGFNEVYIGNTDRLAKNAERSLAFKKFSAPPMSGKSKIEKSDNGREAIDATHKEVRSIERSSLETLQFDLADLDKRVFALENTRAAPSNDAGQFFTALYVSRHTLALLGVFLVTSVSTHLVTSLYDKYRNEKIKNDDYQRKAELQVTVENIGCDVVNIPTDTSGYSNLALKSIQDEKECLDKALSPAQSRVKLLEKVLREAAKYPTPGKNSTTMTR